VNIKFYEHYVSTNTDTDSDGVNSTRSASFTHS